MLENGKSNQKYFCSSCGAENKIGSKYCSTCGQKLSMGVIIPDSTKAASTNEKTGSKTQGVQILISLVLAAVGYKLGSEILPTLSFTSWERYAASRHASYLGSLNDAYAQSELLGGILGAVLFFVLGLIIMRLFSRNSTDKS